MGKARPRDLLKVSQLEERRAGIEKQAFSRTRQVPPKTSGYFSGCRVQTPSIVECGPCRQRKSFLQPSESTHSSSRDHHCSSGRQVVVRLQFTDELRFKGLVGDHPGAAQHRLVSNPGPQNPNFYLFLPFQVFVHMCLLLCVPSVCYPWVGARVGVCACVCARVCT